MRTKTRTAENPSLPLGGHIIHLLPTSTFYILLPAADCMDMYHHRGIRISPIIGHCSGDPTSPVACSIVRGKEVGLQNYSPDALSCPYHTYMRLSNAL